VKDFGTCSLCGGDICRVGTCYNSDCQDVGNDVRSFMARAGIHRSQIRWHEEYSAWQYPVRHLRRECDTQEDVEYSLDILPKAVPGIKIVHSELTPKGNYRRQGFVYFRWNRKDMKARYKELFEKYGVADERLEYTICSGTYERAQPSLPGIPHQSPQGTISRAGELTVMAGWTAYGISQMDHSFGIRICNPHRGGLEANPHSSWRTEVGDEWWLTGSKGDSPEILKLEIMASPLPDYVQANLLENLKNCHPDSSS